MSDSGPHENHSLGEYSNRSLTRVEQIFFHPYSRLVRRKFGIRAFLTINQRNTVRRTGQMLYDVSTIGMLYNFVHTLCANGRRT